MRTVRLIYWIGLAGIILLMSLAGKADNKDLMIFLAILGGLWWFWGAIPARWIGVLLVSSLRCKGCGLVIPAVGRWQIGGYKDHRERHILLAKNPTNGGRLGQIDCPQCSSSILV